MEKPFHLGSFTSYSGIMDCILHVIWNSNEAQDEMDGLITDCWICHGAMGFIEGSASIKLAMTVLPCCKHRFHESCLMQWLTPIELLSTSQGYAFSTPASLGIDWTFLKWTREISPIVQVTIATRVGIYVDVVNQMEANDTTATKKPGAPGLATQSTRWWWQRRRRA